MGRIFVSYSRRDTEVVDRVVDSLQAGGLNVWLDRRDIRAGKGWCVQIVEAIDTCDAFVLMLSRNSAASDNVRKEIDLAQDAGRAIFVLMLEPVKIPPAIHYQLAGLQFVDVRLLGFEEAVRRLADSLCEHTASQGKVGEQVSCQAELVIKGVDLKAFSAEMQEQLLNFVAQLTQTSRTGLAIANLAAGSLHVFIDMPVWTAYQLKTLALNRDRRFKKFRIVSLRLSGNAKYVNISLGILTAAAAIGFLQGLWLGIPSLLAPVVGVTAGKVLTITLAAAVTAGVAATAPWVISGMSSTSQAPSPIPALVTRALIHGSTTAPPVIGTWGSTRQPSPRVTATPRPSRARTSTPTGSPSPAAVPYAAMLKSIVCWLGPDPAYGDAGTLREAELVQLIGPGCAGDCTRCAGKWWIVKYTNPETGKSLTCWVEEQYLDIKSGMDTRGTPVSCLAPKPPSTRRAPVPTQEVCSPDTTYEEDPLCYCSWGDRGTGDPSCYLDPTSGAP